MRSRIVYRDRHLAVHDNSEGFSARARGTGPDLELRRPLGIAIVVGLNVSQMLTLRTTLVVYLNLDRFRLWCAQGFGRRAPVHAHGSPLAGGE